MVKNRKTLHLMPEIKKKKNIKSGHLRSLKQTRVNNFAQKKDETINQ